MVSLYWHPAITPAPARATSVPKTVNALGVDASVKIYILATETDLTLLSLLLGNLSRTTIWWMLSERALTKHRKFKFLYINLDTAEFHNLLPFFCRVSWQKFDIKYFSLLFVLYIFRSFNLPRSHAGHHVSGIRSQKDYLIRYRSFVLSKLRFCTVPALSLNSQDA